MQEARLQVQAGRYDAALYFPPNFAERLGYFRRAIEDRARNGQGENAAASEDLFTMPKPEIIYSTANEKSQIAFTRLSEVLRQWTELIGKKNLEAGGLPAETVKPFTLVSADVAKESGFRGAAVWSKILPMLLLLWTLTGAFYPAVDLCAGEKERGTLETLLSSPAQRSEIVLGKLLTIMLFSVVTAVLNLVSVGVTVWVSLSHFKILGPPPLLSAVWLLAALLPISALFSALCLALAAFARSTKEGQYYLMPLLLVTMPLVILPMSPGMELNLGNSLIPITGVMLLLRSLLEGHYLPALQYSPVVIGVTLSACILAIRWAVDQFNSESVLFRESERLDLALWLRHLLRDRRATPSMAGAVFCAMVIILCHFFIGFSITQPGDFAGFARMAPDYAIGCYPHARFADDNRLDQQRLKHVAPETPQLANYSGRFDAGPVPASAGQCSAIGGDRPVSGKRGRENGPRGRGANAGPRQHLAITVGAGPCACRLRGTGLSRLYSFRIQAHRPQMAGNCDYRLLFRRGSRHYSTIAPGLFVGRGVGLSGRAERQHIALHRIPCGAQ